VVSNEKPAPGGICAASTAALSKTVRKDRLGINTGPSR
jgi:hypothetical protein